MLFVGIRAMLPKTTWKTTVLTSGWTKYQSGPKIVCL